MQLTLLVAFALAASPAPDLSKGPLPFSWPRFEVVDQVEIPEELESNGVPVLLSVYRSRLAIPALLQKYADAFQAGGLYLNTHSRVRLDGPHLTALDWKRRVSYTVLFKPEPDGTTTCILGQGLLQKERAKPSDFAPLFPAATGVTRFEQEGVRLLGFSSPKPPEEIRGFYEEALSKQGFEVTEENGARVFTRERQRIELAITRPKQGQTAVLLTERTAPLQSP